jgi:hypothetical protein
LFFPLFIENATKTVANAWPYVMFCYPNPVFFKLCNLYMH